jgi:dTMP kinase
MLSLGRIQPAGGLREAFVSAGKFIVIEGGEGAGKSTQAEQLYRRLTETRRAALLVREPGTTPLGLYLRDYLKSKQPLTTESELLLFSAARAQLVADQIRPSLAKGITVIADRFTGSTIAYQGHGRGIRRDVINYLNDYVTGGLNPDIVFLLDIDPEEGLHRVGSPQLQMALTPDTSADVGRADVAGQRRFEDQPLAFHNRVRRGYLELAEGNPNWHILEARLTENELAEQIWSAVEPLLPSLALDPTAASPALL